MTETNTSLLADILAQLEHPPEVVVARDDCPAGLQIALYPGAKITLYADSNGRLEAVNVVHETVDDEGVRHIHENDYFLSEPGEHADWIQPGSIATTSSS